MTDRIEACKALIGEQLNATKGRDLFTVAEVQDNLLALYSTLLHEEDPIVAGIPVATG